MQDRSLASYIAELVGTFFLVLIIGTVVALFVAPAGQTTFGSDFAVIGLVHALGLFVLVAFLGGVSGGHFNPAVTVAATILKKINPVDAVVYILAQLTGGLLGALTVKGLLKDEGALTNYGAVDVSDLLGTDFQGMIVEMIGTFLLVGVIVAVAMSIKGSNDYAPFAIGSALGVLVMIFGPLTGGSFNPARWFGPALIGEEWGGVWPYLVGPAAGAILAALFFRFVIEAGPLDEPAEKLKPRAGGVTEIDLTESKRSKKPKD